MCDDEEVSSKLDKYRLELNNKKLTEEGLDYFLSLSARSKLVFTFIY